ncbi:YitT family protein [Furfurilactobacillus sp. WILCCON 0119]|uniref:YitT family protein n=1 Tax=Furfurilactobacillus entadae TaxID=2922307 RepID=UPI0035F06FE3
MRQDEAMRVRDFIFITCGAALYAFGLIYVNVINRLADGGVAGISLILRALLHWNPAYTTFAINIPLLLIGWRLLGRRSFIYTVFGITMLSVWLWIWQHVPISIDIHHDLFIAGALAGVTGGFGCGLVYRSGGTLGGTDIIARIFEKERGVPMGRSLLVQDVLVLAASLVYIDVVHMMYTLLCSFVFTQIVNFTQSGAYAARAIMISSQKNADIADAIIAELQRGVTYLHAEGGFTNQPQKMLYCVVSPREVQTLRRIVERIDDHAFMSIIPIQENIGEGFTYKVVKRRSLF